MIVVTGASGHVGANLVRALLAEHRKVRVLIRESELGLEGLEVERVQGDVRDTASLERAFAGADLVYHLAAIISVGWADADAVHDVNVGGTRNVVRAALSQGVRRLVHFSSIHAFDPKPSSQAIDETRPLNADAPLAYDASKAKGELEVRKGIEQGLDAIIVNPTAILGPHDYRPSPMGELLLMLLAGRVPALVRASFDWVDVRDVVAAAMQAAVRAPRGAKYLLSGHLAPISAVADCLGRASSRSMPRFASPLWLAEIGAPFSAAWSRLRGERPLYTRESLRVLQNHNLVSSARAREELGYAPRPLQETISDTVTWLRQSGRLQDVHAS